MKKLQELTRKNVWELKPYSSARDEYSGVEASVFLDANENPFNTPINRYPDPLQHELKSLIAPIKGVATEQIFLGNGSDEAIDLLFRAFCNPGVDNVVAIEPTYGMYKVCADVNDVEYRKVLLNDTFDLDAKELLAKTDQNTKLIFICSPNNPTGNALNRQQIDIVLDRFDGLVVIDEAYADFSAHESLLKSLSKHENLIVLQTFSKAWGCAAIRLGMAFTNKEIIGILNKIKYPYNVNLLTQQEAIKILKDYNKVTEWVKVLLEERGRLMQQVRELPCTEKVYPTDANFFLVKVTDANAIYKFLVGKGIIVRNRTNVTLCGNCLRITIGTQSENDELIKMLKQYGK